MQKSSEERKTYTKPSIEKKGNLKQVTEGDVVGITAGAPAGP